MSEVIPQLTLVIKSRAQDVIENVVEEDNNLIQTLSMLCAFYTVDDCFESSAIPYLDSSF